MASRANKGVKSARPAAPLRAPVVMAGFGAFALACFAYSPSLKGPFVFDDYHLPFADPHAAQMPARFWIGGVRPVLMATYWANHALSGAHPLGYHVVNIALHFAASALVFFLLKALIELARVPISSVWAALFGSAFFLLHPLQTESVDYIAGRSEILSTLFMFSAWLLFVRRFDGRTAMKTATATLACGLLAIGSKESAVCLAGLLLATDFYWNTRDFGTVIRQRIFLYAPLFLCFIGAAVLILTRLSGSGTAGFALGSNPFAYALTECRVILIYLRLLAVPAGQNIDWQLPLYRSVTEGGALFCLAGMTAIMLAVVFLYRKARAVSFGLLVFLLMLAPTSSFVPIKDALAERRMYAPMVGLIFALTAAAAKLQIKAKLAAPLFAGMLIALALTSHERSLVWADDRLLWSDAVAKNPRNARAYSSLGAALMLAHDCGGAAAEYKKAIDVGGFDQVNGRNLGYAYECSQQLDLALATYRKVIAISPVSDAYTRIGYIEGLHENVTASLAAFGDALRLDPNNDRAYAFRGVAKIAINDIPAAKEDFRHALAIDPANPVASAWMSKLSPAH